MYKFGTIVLVPFPYTDLSNTKLRPALIVSQNNNEKDLVVSFITSNNKFKNKFSVQIESNIETGLKTLSYVLFNKIATVNKKIILGELGIVNKKWITKNSKIFHSTFGF